MDTHSLYRASQVKHFDEAATQQYGIPSEILMERAGQAAFKALQKHWPAARQIYVCCGTGNNGGDGFVLAHLAHEAGLSVSVFLVGDESKIAGTALSVFKKLKTTPVSITLFAPEISFGQADVVIDALLGTGFKPPLAPLYIKAMEAIRSSQKPVLSIDIPSGLHPDTGSVEEAAVQATVTVSFIGLKQGFFTGDGLDQCGAVLFAGLDVPQALYATEKPSAFRLSPKTLGSFLPPRKRNAHKNQFGHVLVIGGNLGFSGAVMLAGKAALRVGAGLVSIATRKEHANFLNIETPELMCHGIEKAGELQPLIERASVIAIGPGLGTNTWARSIWNILKNNPLPRIVDADALKLLAQDPFSCEHWVLTPHPGEAAVLQATTTQKVQTDRFAAAKAIQQRYGGCCVLKGAGTVVVGKEGQTFVCEYGNPGMATAGMGDVLTGVIAGLMAQGMSIKKAAQWGVYLHAKGGDKAANASQRGMLASDLFPFLRKQVNLYL